MFSSLVFTTVKAHPAHVRVVARVVCGAEALGAHAHEARPLARPAAKDVRAGVPDEAADRRQVEQLHAPPVLLEQCVALRECNRKIRTYEFTIHVQYIYTVLYEYSRSVQCVKTLCTVQCTHGRLLS